MRKENIVIIITDYGSFNNFLAELAIELSCKYNVHIICSKENIIQVNDKFEYKNYDIIFYEIAIPRSVSVINEIRSAFKIKKLIKLIKPKIVHAHFTTGIFPAVLFREKNVYYLGTFHGLGFNSSSGIYRLIFILVEFFCFIRLDYIYLINKKDFSIVNYFFRKKSKLYSCFGVGCDLIKFEPRKFNKHKTTKIKKSIGGEGKFIITFVGRFVKFKGFDTVYRTFKLLNEKYPNQIILLLVGGYDNIHSSGLSQIEINDIKKNNSIVDIGFTSSVEYYLSITDLFFFPSKKEGLPVCVMEALAMGVPIVSLDERGISDLVTNNHNGYLIKSTKHRIVVNRFFCIIENLILNRSHLHALSQNCFKDRSKYSRSLFIDEQKLIYQTLLEVIK
jgi:glycosyltransferase involved in cell wall biosynthesis